MVQPQAAAAEAVVAQVADQVVNSQGQAEQAQAALIEVVLVVVAVRLVATTNPAEVNGHLLLAAAEVGVGPEEEEVVLAAPPLVSAVVP